jgi:hypothetical protein
LVFGFWLKSRTKERGARREVKASSRFNVRCSRLKNSFKVRVTTKGEVLFTGFFDHSTCQVFGNLTGLVICGGAQNVFLDPSTKKPLFITGFHH